MRKKNTASRRWGVDPMTGLPGEALAKSGPAGKSGKYNKQSFFLTLLLKSITVYQKTLSPDHGPLRALFPFDICRYTPTCSQYTHQAIARYGWSGLPLAARRLSRCHPGRPGGFDPVPSFKPQDLS